MKLIFLTTFDYPTRYAHALHGLFMARAFAKLLDDDFLFFVNTAVDPTVLRDVRYRRLFGPIGRRIKKMHLRSILLPLSLLWFFLKNPSWRRDTTLFINDPQLFTIGGIFKKIFGLKLMFECHGSFSSHSVRAAEHIFFVTEALRQEFLHTYPNLHSRTFTLQNAVDLELFDGVSDDKMLLRRELNLPLDKQIVGYVGRFKPRGEEKGIENLIGALADLPQDVDLLLVGGTKWDVEEYKKYAEKKGLSERVLFVSYVPYEQVPKYEKSCDVLAYVPAMSKFVDTETSPMKLFEYMAARRPLVVTDSPAIREIVDESCARLVTPGSLQGVAEALKSLLSNEKEATRLAGVAYERVRDNTWERRASKILYGN